MDISFYFIPEEPTNTNPVTSHPVEEGLQSVFHPREIHAKEKSTSNLASDGLSEDLHTRQHPVQQVSSHSLKAAF